MSKPRQVHTSTIEFIVEEPHNTRCKHGRTQGCVQCGTDNRRDTVHRTKGGRGSVGRLISKKGKEK